METGAGIEREAWAFIVFMLMLGHLSIAWTQSGAPVAGYAVHAGASAKLVSSGAALKIVGRDRPSGVARKHRPHGVKVIYRAIAPDPRDELQSLFITTGGCYPPAHVTFIALKEERRMEVWGTGSDGVARLVKEYTICSLSGNCGPKLRRGDNQVPEGVYRVVGLNPYSRYHLSLKLDYPNHFDREMAREDGRTDLGGNIFVHGDCVSAGCIALGDQVIEEVYALVKDAGSGNASVIIAPCDFRIKDGTESYVSGLPDWSPVLYDMIKGAMMPYRLAGA